MWESRPATIGACRIHLAGKVVPAGGAFRAEAALLQGESGNTVEYMQLVA